MHLLGYYPTSRVTRVSSSYPLFVPSVILMPPVRLELILIHFRISLQPSNICIVLFFPLTIYQSSFHELPFFPWQKTPWLEQKSTLDLVAYSSGQKTKIYGCRNVNLGILLESLTDGNETSGHHRYFILFLYKNIRDISYSLLNNC